MTDGNMIAPEGQVFVCGACGKRSRDLFGEQRINRGWDESCMLNALVCLESHLIILDDRVVDVKEGGIVGVPGKDGIEPPKPPEIIV
jgi:hypothetical protein